MTDRIVGVDIAAKHDLCAAATIEGDALVRIAVLRPPVTYQTVLEFVRQQAEGADLVPMDGTGVGAVVFDILSPEVSALRSVRFSAGEAIKADGTYWSAGKAGLVQILRACLDGGVRLELTDGERDLLHREMTAFRMVPGRRPGSLKYEAAPGATDDVLMATALACLGWTLARPARGAERD